ncbi:hypothetical protein L873DRAFT_1827897 [Choiromyces venosus 120613-1]|uniref:Uncharacterized protein n=1 Tax=Choiromyces venosus 120613-1 TaxID=1336337 RepID=A0A3N4JS02_9PEZI|nr:hypothetical protein L873DRAFT_1827897 [Choiromyces venosus 120613-1]
MIKQNGGFPTTPTSKPSAHHSSTCQTPTPPPPFTNQISSLHLHSALEAALHILNYDLPSVHFLLRKMQSLPAEEGMFLHEVLHRIEGDYDNAQAWYKDVSDTEIMEEVWGGKGEGGKGEELEGGEFERLEKKSRREIEEIVGWCVGRFGTGVWRDGTVACVESSEKVKKAGQAQVTGDEQRI